MNWPKTRYTKHLEAQIELLQKENNILLAALLERVGSREAAAMLRTSAPVPTITELKEKARKAYQPDKPVSRSWRDIRVELERKTIPKTEPQDSADKLLERIEAT